MNMETTMNKGDGVNTCKACGSTDLWSAFFSRKGYAVSDGDKAKYRTVCNNCGQFQDRPVKHEKKNKKQ